VVESFEQLSGLSDQELVGEYNSIARHTALGLGFYRDEIHRRQLERSAAEMESLTTRIYRLTVCVAVLTTISVAASVVALAVAVSG